MLNSGSLVLHWSVGSLHYLFTRTSSSVCYWKNWDSKSLVSYQSPCTCIAFAYPVLDENNIHTYMYNFITSIYFHSLLPSVSPHFSPVSFSLSVPVHMCPNVSMMFRGQHVSRSLFSPSVLWVLGIELGSSGLVLKYLLSCLTSLCNNK